MLNRRHFLSSSLAAASVALLPRPLLVAQDAVVDSPASNIAGGREKVSWRVQPFPMQQVRLRDGLMLRAQQINLAYLNQLPNDRLLHMFRLTAGLPSTAAPLGGWEAPDGELRGHFTGGHYLSACALMYASTGDEAIRAKGNELVAELAKCQKANGYLGAYPENFYDRLRNYQKVWAPFYTYHKILAGHLDMYVHCGNRQALATAEKMSDWAASWVAPLTDEQFERIKLVEQGGMCESLFNLYALTGNPKYLALARRFEHKKILDPLAQQQDDLAGNHANTNIPKIIGVARGYELTADDRDHTIATYFWQRVTSQHAYATGGTSNHEFWQAPGKLSTELGKSAEECCCSYNMLKLSRHIYGWTADPHVMDYYERLLYNVRLGTQDPSGMLMYYVSLKPGYWKTFGTPDKSFWCCTGTGVEEYSKLNDSIYWHDDHALYVNLFIPSELNWPQKNLRVMQQTAFPVEEGTTLTLRTTAPSAFPLHIRVPYWATQGATVKINGKLQRIAAEPGTYLTLDRTWHDGDKVEIAMPMSLHTAPLPDNPALQAAMYGPLVLAAQMGRDGLTHEMIYGDLGPFAKGQKDYEPPTARASGQSPWLKRTSSPHLEFVSADNTRAVPLYTIMDERYSVYWKVENA